MITREELLFNEWKEWQFGSDIYLKDGWEYDLECNMVYQQVTDDNMEKSFECTCDFRTIDDLEEFIQNPEFD